MARRRAKEKSRRKNGKSINILSIAESALIANAITSGLFNTNLAEFFTGNTGSASFGSDGSSVMSLPELLGIGANVKFGGNYGPGRTFGTQIRANWDNNWSTMAISIVTIPFAFKLGKKLTTQPRATANRMLKMAGIKELRL